MVNFVKTWLDKAGQSALPNPPDTYWYVERCNGGNNNRWLICATDKLDVAILEMIRIRHFDGIEPKDNNAMYRLRCCRTGEIIPGDAIV